MASKASSMSTSASNGGQVDQPTLHGDLEKQSVRADDQDIQDSGSEKAPSEDVNVVSWDGPDDPQNPMNWSSAKKVTHIGIVSLVTLLSPLASTIIAPATLDVMNTFHTTNETLGAFVTSVYLLGYTFGPLIIAPMSELYGRYLMYNICNAIFLIFSIACAVSNSMGALIAFRFFAGIGACCPITIGAGTVADMVAAEKRGKALASWIVGSLIGPIFGPLIGGYLAESKGWRWDFWLMAILVGAVLVTTLLFLDESYAYVLLDRKTKRLRKETGNQKLRSALDSDRTPAEHFKISIVRPLRMLFGLPVVFAQSLYMALVYAYFYLLFTTFPRVFQGQYGWSNSSIGLTYLGAGVGSLIGVLICGALSDRLVRILTERNGGDSRPEYRLPLTFLGTFIVPAGLFLYGWSADKKLPWIVPIIGTGLLGVGMMVTFIPGQTYCVDLYPVYAASVSAAATVSRSVLAALLPLAGNKMYDTLGLGWGNSLLGFVALAFTPLPFVLWKFGERIRNSRFSKVTF